MFSPTSLVEERQDQFISPGAGTALSSSQMQAFWPYLFYSVMWGLLGWRACILAQQQVGFLVVCKPLWPSRRAFFLFFLFCIINFVLFIF